MTYFLIRTMTVSAQYLGIKLGGSRHPQSPTVNCLSEKSDIASYFVDVESKGMRVNMNKTKVMISGERQMV